MAEKIEFAKKPEGDEPWDVAIIGSGPAALTAAIYTTRGAASTIIFLSAIYHGMGEEGKKYVEATFEKIRKGGYLKPTP